MKKYEGKSIRKGTTHTGKIPDSVGFGSSRSGGGHIRKLNKKEENQQHKFLNHV